MSAPIEMRPASGSFRVLTHAVRCRDLAGCQVQMEQNTIVVVVWVDVLPGWCMLTDENDRYAPVRDEWVGDVSVPATQGPYGAYPPFPPSTMMDTTIGVIVEVEPINLIMTNDVEVCSSAGERLPISSKSKISIFAHSPHTFSWFKTSDGNQFVVDSRHDSIRMDPAPEVKTTPEPASPTLAPSGTPVVPKVGPGPETIDKRHVPIEATKAASPAASTLSEKDRDDELAHLATPFPAEISEADMSEITRGVQASPSDFTQTNADFCEACFCFSRDHAAWCPDAMLFK